MKTLKLKITFFISLILTFLSGLAFINNISIVVSWWKAFFEANGNTSVLSHDIVGVFPYLDWTCVDYSCVTTFIPFLGFLLIAMGCLKVLRGATINPEFFPFFKSYDQLNIAFGLIGTLWGIIVIGYYDMDTVSMSNLMMCLHTALFSTLSAVIWVFIIDHPILRPFMKKLLKESGNEETDDEDIISLFERLRDGASGLKNIWEQEKSQLKEFSEKVELASKGMKELTSASKDACDMLGAGVREATSELQKTFDEFAKTVEERQLAYEKSLESRIKALDEDREKVANNIASVANLINLLGNSQRELMSGLEKAFADNDELRERLNAECNSGNEARKVVASLSGELDELKKLHEELKLRHENYVKNSEVAKEKANKEYLALSEEKLRLNVALDEAKKNAEANMQRAVKSEKLVAKIKSVFGNLGAD